MSLAVINANSPYEVKVALADDTLCFITDYDAEIFVTFERDDILHNGLVYQFGISNPKGVKSPRDPKVRETILAIVEEFFAKNNAAFLYICDTSGGMQKMRNRLFKYWFGIYGERREYVFLPQTITDEEGNDNYAALIIRKDNPQFADLVSEFMATVNLLNTKPEDYDEQVYINAEEIKKPENRTKEMIERCCGSWVGEQSAEDIIANINESKMSKSEPVKFAY